MGCDCPGEPYLTEYEQDAIELELGPAYEDYKNGKVHIHREWEQHKRLTPDWVDDCCTELKPDWTYAELWLDHTIMLVVFYVVSGALLAGFIALRNVQPFKFRDVRTVFIFWFILVANMTTLVVVGNMGGTAHTASQLIISFCGPPAMLVYYIVKDIQLAFIHYWQKAKLNQKSFDQLMLFHRFRFVLSFKFFVACTLGVIGACLIPTIYALVGRETFVHAVGKNAFDTLRCEWWYIPEEYQQPNSNSQLCECVRYATALPGGDYDLCAMAVATVCFDTGYTPEPAEDGFCAACLSDVLTNNIGNGCSAWFQEFYNKGSCGHPARVPHAQTCGYGIFGDEAIGYACAALCYFLLVVNLLTLIPLIGARDDFGLIHENLICASVEIVSFLFNFSGLFRNNGGLLNWYYDGLGADYRGSFLFAWLAIWWATLVVLGYPMLLYVFKESRWARRRRRKVVTEVTDAESTTEVGRRSSFTSQSSYADDPEEQLEQCLKVPKLFAIYSEFAVEAFHVESIKFLEECLRCLTKAAATDMSLGDLTRLQYEMRIMHDTYIAADSPMEVNIPAKMRDEITKALKALESTLESKQDTDVVAPAMRTLADAYRLAFDEIRRLLARDAWPRFRHSRYWQAYNALIALETRLTIAVLEMAAVHGALEMDERSEGSEAEDDRPKAV